MVGYIARCCTESGQPSQYWPGMMLSNFVDVLAVYHCGNVVCCISEVTLKSSSISTEMGDHLWVSILSMLVCNHTTRSTQPFIHLGLPN